MQKGNFEIILKNQMKTIIILICIISNVNAFCQYVKFPIDSAIWRVDYWNFDACGIPQPNAQYQYTFDGDSIVNSISYSKVYSSGISNCLSFGFCGLLRDDTLNQKVYFIQPDSSSEKLLYDFSLNVGDTVPDLFNYTGVSVIVDSIDTINYGGIARRRFRYALNMGPHNDPYIIEGIGNVSGLLVPLESPTISYYLICFSIGGQYIFPDSTGTCILINKTNQIGSFPNLTISPIPVVDVSRIDITEDILVEVEICDYFGNVKSRLESQTGQFYINKNDFSSGFYLCKAYTRNKIIVLKFIIL